MSDSSVVYFYLEPENEAARDIVSIFANESFTESRPDGATVLRIGFHHEPKTPGQLISFGSNPRLNDLILPQGYPRRQCHFWMHPTTGELLLQDDTDDKSTILDVAGGSKYHLPDTGPRQRVLIMHLSMLIIMQPAHFRLSWGPMTGRPEEIKAMVNNYRMSQSLAQASVTPLLCPTPSQLPARRGPLVHHVLHELGRGTSSIVYQTIDLTTGDHLAVKTWQHAANINEQWFGEIVRKEMEITSELSHPNIAAFVHGQGGEPDEPLELFMKPYQGSLELLLGRWRASKGAASNMPPFFQVLIRQILLALEYLEGKQIIHRDIKPDNVLFDDSINFFITDFGSSKVENLTTSLHGTPLYMAPEIFKGAIQSPKLDVWSLGVLILDVLDIMPRRVPKTMEALRRSHVEWHDSLIQIAKTHLPQILPMLELDPEDRYGAKDCLDKIFTNSAKFSLLSSQQGSSTRSSENRWAAAAPGSALDARGSQPRGNTEAGRATFASAGSLASLPFPLDISEGSNSPRSPQGRRAAGAAAGSALTEENLRLRANQLTCRTRKSPAASLGSPVFEYEISSASTQTTPRSGSGSSPSPRTPANALARQGKVTISQSPPATRRAALASSQSGRSGGSQNPTQQGTPAISGPIASSTSQSPRPARLRSRTQKSSRSGSGPSSSATAKNPRPSQASPQNPTERGHPSGSEAASSATPQNPRHSRTSPQNPTRQQSVPSPLGPSSSATTQSSTARPPPARSQNPTQPQNTPSPLGPTLSATSQSPSSRRPPARSQNPTQQSTPFRPAANAPTSETPSLLPPSQPRPRPPIPLPQQPSRTPTSTSRAGSLPPGGLTRLLSSERKAYERSTSQGGLSRLLRGERSGSGSGSVGRSGSGEVPRSPPVDIPGQE